MASLQAIVSFEVGREPVTPPHGTAFAPSPVRDPFAQLVWAREHEASAARSG